MTILSWDTPGQHTYTAGVDRGVFYPQNHDGVAWSGLVTVKESVDKAGQSIIYVDGQKQVNQLDLGDFSATIEATTYPDEFLPYDGYVPLNFSGQARPLFNFSYRTLHGDDLNGKDRGYSLHLVYNCQAKPTQRSHSSLNLNSDVSLFSWDLTTSPLGVENARATSHFIVDSETVLPGVLTAIENYLYGTDTTAPAFPTVGQLLGIFEANAVYTIIDNGDGTWTANAPDSALIYNVGGSFEFDWPWVDYLDPNTYVVKSF